MASVPKNHAGILREENIALRQILGYRLETLQPCPPYNVPPIGNYLPGTSIKDILLVCVDVDTGGGYEIISPGQSFHIGISIFDTRCLIKQLSNPCDSITSFQYINRGDTKPCKRAVRSFLFGETELVDLSDFAAKFSSLTQGRDYILVAHGINEDVKFFNNINPEISNRACYVLDTVKAAQHPLHLDYRYSLKKLLKIFKIRYAKLHAAGNDAHFALKALLTIAVHDGRIVPETITAANEELFVTLDAIAHDTRNLPIWVEKPPKIPKVKTKLGVKANRRLRAERKAARRILQELPYAGELDGQDGEDGEGLLGLFQI
jgi:hypothetical protein